MSSIAIISGKSSNNEREAELVRAAQKGDLEAFNQIVSTYQDRIYSLSVRLLGDADLADDITQNTFLTAYLNLSRFRNGSFRGWLYRIATNACYDVHRQHKRHPVLSVDTEVFAEERLSPIDSFSSATGLPEVELERREAERTVQQVLDQLDGDQRAVVVLVDLQDFNYLETAQALGIPIGTVKSRLARARLRLHQLLSATV
jgi:RNA polymerase sigma-70 factor (ECF subfamily)